MIFEYVVTDYQEVEKDKFEQVIILDGKLVATSRDEALLKIGALLGDKKGPEIEVVLRQFAAPLANNLSFTPTTSTGTNGWSGGNINGTSTTITW